MPICTFNVQERGAASRPALPRGSRDELIVPQIRKEDAPPSCVKRLVAMARRVRHGGGSPLQSGKFPDLMQVAVVSAVGTERRILSRHSPDRCRASVRNEAFRPVLVP